MAQKEPCPIICHGVMSTDDTFTLERRTACLSLHPAGTHPGGGLTMKTPITRTTMPWMNTQTTNVWAYPDALIIDSIGATVRAVPIPYAPAVMPAQRPRWSGNHLSACPMHAP